MGQAASCRSSHCRTRHRQREKRSLLQSFPDLTHLPPELAVQVLSHLDATDLCLAACVNEYWCDLANVEPLWKGCVDGGDFSERGNFWRRGGCKF